MAHNAPVAFGGIAALGLEPPQPTIAPPPFAVMAAINAAATGEGSLDACSEADERLFYCADLIDGPLEDIDQILPCACCSSGVAYGDTYGQCANFISRSMSHLSSSWTLFYGMDMFCSSEPAGQCATGDDTSNPSATGATGTSGSSFPTSVRVSLTQSGFPEETEGPDYDVAPGDVHPQCSSLGQTLLDCAEATPDLLYSPVEDLAGCFCYETGRGGSSTYVGDEIADWATTCADWASSARSLDAFSVATPFTSMCADYSATALDDDESSPTFTRPFPTFSDITGGDDEDDDSTNNDDDDTSNNDDNNNNNSDDESSGDSQPSPSSSDGAEGDNGNSGSALRVSVAAGLVALVAAVAAI